MPPSSDGPSKANKSKDSSSEGKGDGQDGKKTGKKRGKKKRKRGGQPGHARHERPLIPESEVDNLHVVKPTECKGCGNRLHGHDNDPLRHQVTELPPITPTVDEWRLHALGCDDCGMVTRASLPAGVPKGSFGPRVQAVASVASSTYRMSKRLVQAFMFDICGVTIALGSVSKLEQKTAEAIAQRVAEAHEYVKKAPVVNADETSWRENMKKAWLWVAATPLVAVFLIQSRRTKECAKNLLGEGFAGLLVTDRFGSYNFVEALRRQVCWSHLLRDIEAFRAYGRSGVLLANQLQKPARKLIHFNNRVRDGTMTRAAFIKKAKPHRKKILAALRRGRGYVRTEISGVCKEILKLEDALFNFVDHESVPPTNNHAEHMVRHPVIWRKLSFGTDSPKGSRYVESMLTVVMTLRLQNRNVLEYVTEACEAQLSGRQAPSLLPAEQPPALALAA